MDECDQWMKQCVNPILNLSNIQRDIYFGSKRAVQLVYPTSQTQKQSIELKVSLKMLLQEATSCADEWKDVNRKYNDRRSFPTFLRHLQMCGLDWHKYIVSEDNDSNVSNQTNRWSSLQASSHDVVHLSPELTSNSDWVMANKYYGRSLSLMRLLQRIREESRDEFSRKQAELLESFLGHLVMIQQEQRVVACSFSKHLELLRKSLYSLEFSSYVIDDDEDRDICPLSLSKNAMEYYMWQQKHLFDSLYIISRELTWLLKKLKDSHFTSPLIIKESYRILEIIGVFISKFKKSKESLDQYLLDKSVSFVEEDKMMQLVNENKEVLDRFGNHIKVFQAEGVGKGSVIENLLDCLGCACKISMDDYGEENIYLEAVLETIALIEEARKKLNSDRFSTLPGGSPLGNITLWRILFESSLAGLRLDLISKKRGEAVKALHIKENNSHNKSILSQQYYLLHAKISLLLSEGDTVLLDFVAMHRTVAEITYMLGDAFTTGGAGMKALTGETSSPGTADKNDKEMEMVLDFPWDKHNVLDEIKIDLQDPKWLDFHSFEYGPDPDSDTEFT